MCRSRRLGTAGWLAVVGAIHHHRSEGSGDLREQGADLETVALFAARWFAGEDLAAVGIDRGMQPTPAPPAALPMPSGQPLARTVRLQPGRVDHDIHRPAARLDTRQRRREHQAGTAPRGGGKSRANARRTPKTRHRTRLFRLRPLAGRCQPRPPGGPRRSFNNRSALPWAIIAFSASLTGRASMKRRAPLNVRYG